MVVADVGASSMRPDREATATDEVIDAIQAGREATRGAAAPRQADRPNAQTQE